MKNKFLITMSRPSNHLEKRIAENLKGQQINFIDWIFKRLKIKKSSNILELCCGTGSQTMELLKLVGKDGRVFALDVSKDALEKLVKIVPHQLKGRIITIESKMENFSKSLKAIKIEPPAFDLIFCSYGLYYSEHPEETLNETLILLKRDGKMAIIGPYRSNNGPLFDLLEEADVKIDPFITYTSRDFMELVVIPWSIGNFKKVNIHTVVNHVIWSNPENIITYWKNSTFYDDEKLSRVEKKISEYFQHNLTFENEKWIMMVEMSND